MRCVIAFLLILFIAMVSYGQEQKPFVAKIIVDYTSYEDRGSGSLIESDLVLTCFHNIRDRRTQPIWAEFSDGTRKKCSIVKKDPTLDLCLLRIDPVLYPVVEVAAKPVERGDQITICGFPLGKDYKEISGKVIGRRCHRINGPETVFLVSEKSIAGMSGGPALRNGKLVGVLFGSNVYSNISGVDAIHGFIKDVD